MTEPVRNLKVDGVPIRSTPPCIVEWCRVPQTGYGLTTCGFLSSECKGSLLPCHRCFFQYCDHHYGMHHKAMQIPPRVMEKFAQQVADGIKRAAADPRRTDYIRPDAPESNTVN